MIHCFRIIYLLILIQLQRKFERPKSMNLFYLFISIHRKDDSTATTPTNNNTQQSMIEKMKQSL